MRKIYLTKKTFSVVLAYVLIFTAFNMITFATSDQETSIDQEDLPKQDIWKQLEEVSSDVFTGKVLEVTSLWVNTSKGARNPNPRMGKQLNTYNEFYIMIFHLILRKKV